MRTLSLAACIAGTALVAASGVAAQDRRPPFGVASPGGPRDIGGVWWVRQAPQSMRPVDGGLPPFTPHGKEEFERHQKAEEAGTPIGDTAARCLPHGVPRIMGSPYPIDIIVRPKQITIVHETNHNLRFIYMDEPQPKTAERTYLGHSVGHWEGDTLVIDTAFFNDQTRIDESGVTHSDKLHVVERLRKIENGTMLEVLFTIEDPVTFTKPWTTRRTYDWRPDLKLMEYVCDNNRNAPNADNVTVAR